MNACCIGCNSPLRARPSIVVNLMAVGAKGRDKAAMHRRAIEPHGARAAVAGVAAFLDPEPSQIAQKGAQALTGPRRLGNVLPLILTR